jgi:hypothetical protein
MSSFRHRAMCLLLAAFCAGCSLPEGDQSSPSQVHYLWLHVRANNDTERLWDLLHPDLRDEFKRWHTAEKLLVNEIKSAYPAEDATAALTAIGGTKRGEAESPKALFLQLLKSAPALPDSLGATAARVRSETLSEDGASASLRTYGGDEILVRKGADDQWYVTLQPDELVMLKAALERAEQNLARVRTNLDKLGRHKK